MGIGSRTAPRGRRAAVAACLAAVSTALGLLCAPAAVGSSAAPSAEQVDAQRREATDLAAVAAARAGRTQRARAELARVARAAGLALEELDLARAAADRARQRAAEAHSRGVEARARLGSLDRQIRRDRADLGRLAAAAYRGGGAGSVTSVSGVVRSGDPTELARTLALLEWVAARRGQAVTSLEAAADAQKSAAASAQDAAELAAAERAGAAVSERAATSARRRVDELVAEQETLVRALADAQSRAVDAAERARELADRMAAAREVAARRARAAQSARATQIAAGRAVVPAGQCAGADVSGYPNGEIPRSALCPLWGAGGHALRADAAAAFNALSRAYAAAWGRPVCVTDSYRSYQMQVELKARKPVLAATPGTSNHGWGRAVDLCDGVNEFGTPTYVWMTQNAARFGWYHPSWAEPTGSKPEAWHWEFGG